MLRHNWRGDVAASLLCRSSVWGILIVTTVAVIFKALIEGLALRRGTWPVNVMVLSVHVQLEPRFRV